MIMMIDLPKIGEQIIVHNIRHAKATVSDIIWIPLESRYVIELSWKDTDNNFIGKSKVSHYDENKIWFRELLNN